MRIFLRFLLLAAAVTLVFPFLTTSLLVDRKGVLEQGQVVGKDEWITVGYSSWTRHEQIQVQYQPPDAPGLAFLNADPGEEQFDRLHKGDRVELRYLLARDLPTWPGMKTLRAMHLLPAARLATQQTGSRLKAAMRPIKALIALATAIALLLAWRALRIPFFQWIAAFCVLTAIVWSLVAQFPTPTPSPKTDVQFATGTIKSVEYWKELFMDKQSRDAIRWTADQPIAIVGVQFVPEGHTEPVVAVDLIDAGSISGLAERARVSVEYESKMPRVAQIRGARRQFAEKNFRGLLVQAALVVLTGAVLWSAALLFGKFFRRLIRPN